MSARHGGRHRKYDLIVIDRTDGREERTPAEGLPWASALARLSRTEGGSGTVEECAKIARRLCGGEVIATTARLYKLTVAS